MQPPLQPEGKPSFLPSQGPPRTEEGSSRSICSPPRQQRRLAVTPHSFPPAQLGRAPLNAGVGPLPVPPPAADGCGSCTAPPAPLQAGRAPTAGPSARGLPSGHPHRGVPAPALHSAGRGALPTFPAASRAPLSPLSPRPGPEAPPAPRTRRRRGAPGCPAGSSSATAASGPRPPLRRFRRGRGRGRGWGGGGARPLAPPPPRAPTARRGGRR